MADIPEAELFADAPAAWRGYVLQARAAEQAADGLDRCIAYPDLPGNRWPAGFGEAYCRYRHTRVASLADIDGHLQRGDVAGLERLMSGYLARHFLRDGHGEELHFAIDQFSDDGDDADRISARWLELAPHSAYAHLARAAHIDHLAHAARGNAFARDTPPENMRRMSELATQAIPLYQRAIAIEPRAMPAYAGLVTIARTDSRPELLREAVASAWRQDPACWHVADQRMRSALPRWGGSYEEMLAIAAELSPHLGRRPLLALVVAAPYADRGNRLRADGKFMRQAMQSLEIALRTAPVPRALEDAVAVARRLPEEEGGPDHWKAFALLLQRARFGMVNDWDARTLTTYLMTADPAWALRHATHAVTLDPEHAWGQFLLAGGYRMTGQVDAAERHLLASMQGGSTQQVLAELAWMFLSPTPGADPMLDRAQPYIDRYVAAYPDDPDAWLMQIQTEMIQTGDQVSGHLIRGFLARADREDPRQAEWVRLLEDALDENALPADLRPSEPTEP